MVESRVGGRIVTENARERKKMMRAMARELILGDSYIDCQRSRERGASRVDVECHNLCGHCGVGH